MSMSTIEAETEQLIRTEAKWLWQPVRQLAADSFLVVLIVSFAVTVIVVRVFLQLSGYPQVGNSTFHIAHMLWGGLLLFVALVAVLMWANRWVMWLAALAGGIGVGLFIDEVGKFITQSNDYFFPLAFPIIYAFLLACVWMYVRVRRAKPRDTRTLLYNSLEEMKQVLDHDLDPFEHVSLLKSLNEVLAKAENPNERNLARALLTFVQAEDVRLSKEPNWFERTWGWTRFVGAHWPSRRTFRWILVVGFALSGFSSFFEITGLVGLVSGVFDGLPVPPFVIESGKSTYELNDPMLLWIHAFAIVFTGVMCLGAAALLLAGRERLGLRIGSMAMILSLTIVSLLTFYLSQLYAIGDALTQLALLLAATIYRWRFFLNE
jgi:hypothetical protein